MNRESFLDTLRQQYSDEIRGAFLECAHERGEQVDFQKLDEMLTKLMQNASVDGLPEQEFVELVQSTIPYAWEQLELSRRRQPGQKAA